jgi:hypothetical protein
MLLPIVALIPILYPARLVRLSSDTGLLGGLANSRRRTMVLSLLTGSLLSIGLWSAASVLQEGG